MEWLAANKSVSPKELIVFGRSLGGAVACHLAATHQVKGVFLQSTFSRLADVAADKYPIFPVRQVMRNQFDCVSDLRRYSNQVSQLHGDSDRVVPIHFGEVLFDSASSEKKQFVRLAGLGHNDVPDLVSLKYLAPFVDDLLSD